MTVVVVSSSVNVVWCSFLRGTFAIELSNGFVKKMWSLVSYSLKCEPVKSLPSNKSWSKASWIKMSCSKDISFLFSALNSIITVEYPIGCVFSPVQDEMETF